LTGAGASVRAAAAVIKPCRDDFDAVHPAGQLGEHMKK